MEPLIAVLLLVLAAVVIIGPRQFIFIVAFGLSAVIEHAADLLKLSVALGVLVWVVKITDHLASMREELRLIREKVRR